MLERARVLGLRADSARQVGNIAVWYYNRILLRLNPKDDVNRDLPPNANRYLVPICLALACEHRRLPIGLDRLVRVSARPTRRTVEIAHELYSTYARMLARSGEGGSASPRRPTGPPRTVRASPPVPGPTPRFQSRPLPTGVSAPGPVPRTGPTRPVALAASPVTALATQAPREALERGAPSDTHRPTGGDPSAGVRARQPSTNAWARRRIAELSRSLDLPERVRNRSLEFYDRIVEFHRTHGPGPPISKRVNLSPRLNWSLVYTTIYLGCRFEEYPKDLRDILGPNARQGSIREMYRLYRFYKRKLRLLINRVDVKTFIESWLDGYEFGELVLEKMAASETAGLRKRAFAIAERASRQAALRGTSTKMIAAGALTTALAERAPPGPLSAFYRAIARFLHMSEESIRFVVAQLAGVL